MTRNRTEATATRIHVRNLSPLYIGTNPADLAARSRIADGVLDQRTSPSFDVLASQAPAGFDWDKPADRLREAETWNRATKPLRYPQSPKSRLFVRSLRSIRMVFGGFGLLICIAAIHLPSGENDPFESCPSIFVMVPFARSSSAKPRSARISASVFLGERLSTRHGDPARQSEVSMAALTSPAGR